MSWPPPHWDQRRSVIKARTPDPDPHHWRRWFLVAVLVAIGIAAAVTIALATLTTSALDP